MIHYAETYQRWSHEDYEIGDTNDKGFKDENAEATFSEMIDLLAHCEPSCCPPSASDYLCFTDYDYNKETRDWFETGINEIRSYHPKTDRDARYMLKAWRVNHK